MDYVGESQGWKDKGTWSLIKGQKENLKTHEQNTGDFLETMKRPNDWIMGINEGTGQEEEEEEEAAETTVTIVKA